MNSSGLIPEPSGLTTPPCCPSWAGPLQHFLLVVTSFLISPGKYCQVVWISQAAWIKKREVLASKRRDEGECLLAPWAAALMILLMAIKQLC